MVTVSRCVWISKAAETAAAAVIVTTQVPRPEHPAPVHPAKTEPPAAVAVNVTTVVRLYASLQSPPHTIPAGDELTDPVPAPVLFTVSWNCTTVNVAVTVVAAFTVTTHVPVPLHPPPLHPVKSELGVGAAVSVTTVPALYDSVQSPPQLIPAGFDVTVPVPVPALATVRACCVRLNVAVTVTFTSTVITQVPVPEHPPPDQPVNVELADGVAVSVTLVPNSKKFSQVTPHVIPAGVELTDPVPEPARLTSTIAGNRSNRAVAVALFDPAAIVQVLAVPLQAPDQPTNDEFAFGAAVKVTDTFDCIDALQVAPQEIPPDDEVTLPSPVPVLVTVMVRDVCSGPLEPPELQPAPIANTYSRFQLRQRIFLLRFRCPRRKPVVSSTNCPFLNGGM
jgi:hypothetical protein